MVKQTSENLASNSTVTILGRGATLNKAITVCEIVKRVLEEEALEQKTNVYRKEFNGKSENCIEIELTIEITE